MPLFKTYCNFSYFCCCHTTGRFIVAAGYVISIAILLKSEEVLRFDIAYIHYKHVLSIVGVFVVDMLQAYT